MSTLNIKRKNGKIFCPLKTHGLLKPPKKKYAKSI